VDNTTNVIDPIAGTPVASVSTGSLYSLAVSDDGQYLYGGTSSTTAENGVPMGGASSVQRFLLPGLTPDIQIPVFSESGLELLPPSVALVRVAPGASHTVMASLASGRPEFYASSVVLYTDSTPCVWQVFLAHLWQLTLAHLWKSAGQLSGMEMSWASG
jgi:hypothetical protein